MTEHTLQKTAAGRADWLLIIALAAAVLAVSALTARMFWPGAETPPDRLTLTTSRMAYSHEALTTVGELASDGRSITVHLDNRDFLPHTFTIDALGLDFRLPAGESGDVTFEAPPGAYRFYCAIAGHEELGMVGTLEVRP